MTPSSPTKFATALRAFFAQHLPLTRGLSSRTVSSYRDTFVLLLRFLAARHGCGVVDLELQHLRPDDLLAFLDHLETERKNSVATRAVDYLEGDEIGAMLEAVSPQRQDRVRDRALLLTL